MFRKLSTVLVVGIVSLGVTAAWGQELLLPTSVLLIDDFADNDVDGWTIVQGDVRADGVSVPNFQPTAGEMNFLTSPTTTPVTTEVYVDWPTAEPNTPVHVEAAFRLRQPNGAEGGNYVFTFGFKDTVTDQVYYEGASLNKGFYGSGFHSWNTSNQLIAGLDPDAHLTDGWNNLRLVFDTFTGVEVYHNNALVAQWSNYKDIEQVDQLYFNANAFNNLSWFVDDVRVSTSKASGYIFDDFEDGDHLSDPSWDVVGSVTSDGTKATGSMQGVVGELNFGIAAGTQAYLDFPSIVDDKTIVQADFQLRQTNAASPSSYRFNMGLVNIASGVTRLERASLNPGHYGTSGFHGFYGPAINAYLAGLAGASLSNVPSQMTLRFNPYTDYFDIIEDGVLVARYTNYENVSTVDRLVLQADGVVSWFVDDVLVQAVKPTVGDGFHDGDYTNDPAWVVDSGVFSADGTQVSNASLPGWLSFGTAAGTQIHLDIDGIQDGAAMTVRFLLWQTDGAATAGYVFKMGLMDTDSGEVYWENATLQVGYYGGPSGFHGYNSAGEMIGGTAGEALGNGVMFMEMRFDPTTGVEIYKDEVLVASWPNFKDLTKVDRLLFNNGNGVVSWFVDGVEVYATTYDYEPEYCGDMNTFYFTGDISGASSAPDCYVNMTDLALMASQWLECTDPDGTGCQNVMADRVIPAGSATVDADLSDWADAEWTDLDFGYYGSELNDALGSQFALRWDDATNRIYVAIVVPDTDNMFEDASSSWNTSDRIEVYSQGSGEGGGSYALNQDFAQQYVLGIMDSDHDSLWAEFGNGDPCVGLGYADLLYAGKVDSVTGDLVYEVGVKLYENYDPNGGATSVVTDLSVGDVVRFDVVIGTLYYDFFSSADAFAMWSENDMTGKSGNANNIAQYRLMEVDCGIWGFMTADISGAGGSPDCVVDLSDFAAIAANWMQCSDPAEPTCDTFWK